MSNTRCFRGAAVQHVGQQDSPFGEPLKVDFGRFLTTCVIKLHVVSNRVSCHVYTLNETIYHSSILDVDFFFTIPYFIISRLFI